MTTERNGAGGAGSARGAIDAARKAVAEGLAIVEKTRADYGLPETGRGQYPLTHAWYVLGKALDDDLVGSRVGAPPLPLPSLAEMVEQIVEYERTGRKVSAALGLSVLRERVEALEPENVAAAWIDFVNTHLHAVIAPERIAEMIGGMVHRRGLLHCPKCAAEAKAACPCGVPYLGDHRWAMPVVPATKLISALDRAAAAIAADPAKSNRAIAREIGVSFETVRRARADAENAAAACVTDVSPDPSPEQQQ